MKNFKLIRDEARQRGASFSNTLLPLIAKAKILDIQQMQISELKLLKSHALEAVAFQH